MFAAHAHKLPLAASLCMRATGTLQVFALKPTTINVNVNRLPKLFRSFANDAKDSFIRRPARRRTFEEAARAPPGSAAFGIGQGVTAGAAVFGLGALCYYGLGLSNEAGAIDRAGLWPDYVKERIRSTYMYFGGSIAISAASAAAVFRSPVLMNLVMKNGWMAMLGTFALMIGSGMIVRGMEYQEGLGMKQLAWMAHCSILGGIVAPICFIGGPLLLRAAWYTAGIVGGLSVVSVCAPSEKFLNMGGPLAIGLGVVFAASIGSMFLAPTTALGAGLYSISLYGGLVLFSGLMLYDTQRIIRAAEVYPTYGVRPFDPVNAAISIYLDTLNIFIRIATILAGGGSGKRK